MLQPQPIGETMIGGTVGVVEASNNPKFAVGDTVVGGLGWQEYGLSSGAGLNKVDATRIPMSAYLGVLGMPGVTAWYGIKQICAPKPGETVLVSAASGAVGSAAGQLAKFAGCHVVGIAGGPDKCRYVTDELGFDACIDHRQHTDVRSMNRALKEAAPKGIDAIFENVGGVGLDGALPRLNAFARIALCGLIAGYEGRTSPSTTYGRSWFPAPRCVALSCQNTWNSGRRPSRSWPRASPADASSTASPSRKAWPPRPRPLSACLPARISASRS